MMETTSFVEWRASDIHGAITGLDASVFELRVRVTQTCEPYEGMEQEIRRVVRQARALIGDLDVLLGENQAAFDNMDGGIAMAADFDLSQLAKLDPGPAAPGARRAQWAEHALGRIHQALQAASSIPERRFGFKAPEMDPAAQELQQSLVLRAAFANLRHDVGRSSVTRAIGALRHFCESVVFFDVRLDDKLALLGLLERLEESSSGEVHASQRVLGDLHGTLELLRSINQREVLRVHDRAWVERCRTLLNSTLANEATDDVVDAVSALYGLDDKLDATIRAMQDRANWTPAQLVELVEALPIARAA